MSEPLYLTTDHAQALTKREWFAGMALQGLLAHASGEDPHKSPALAFVLADAMIEAGKEKS